MRRVGVLAAFLGLVGAAMIVAWGAPRASPAQSAVLPAPRPTTWCTRQLGRGVTWSYRTAGLPSGVPRVNVVEVDPAQAVVRVVESTYAPTAYETVLHMAQRTRALVAINGGFFDNNGSPPSFGFVSMLRVGGALVAQNPVPRPALGGQFILQNFPTTVQAMNLDGGGSSTFVVNGAVVNGPANGSPRPVIDGLMVFQTNPPAAPRR
jgi:hypothetical protein